MFMARKTFDVVRDTLRNSVSRSDVRLVFALFLVGLVLAPLVSPARRSQTPGYESTKGAKVESTVRELVRRRMSGNAQHYKVSRAVLKHARRHNVDPLLVLAVVEQESRFNAKAKGRHGEIGLMQIKPDTATWMASKMGMRAPRARDLWNPETNVKWGVAYLAYLHGRYSKMGLVFLDAYNMGVARMNRRYREGGTGNTGYALGVDQRLRRMKNEIDLSRRVSRASQPLDQG